MVCLNTEVPGAPGACQQTQDGDRRTAGCVSSSSYLTGPQGMSAPRTRSRWASRSFCIKSLRASRTAATSTSGLWSAGAGEGRWSRELVRAIGAGLVAGLSLCHPE